MEIIEFSMVTVAVVENGRRVGRCAQVWSVKGDRVCVGLGNAVRTYVHRKDVYPVHTWLIPQ